MINNSYIKIYENWFITTGMPRQERKNTTEPSWARRIFTRSRNKVAKIGEKMRHTVSYNLYQNGDRRNKRSARGARWQEGALFSHWVLFYTPAVFFQKKKEAFKLAHQQLDVC